MTIPSITPLPEAPSRQAPSTFSALTDAFLASLAAFVTETNLSVAAMNTDLSNAITTVSTGTTEWVSGTTYVIGDLRFSPISFLTYRRITNGAGTTDPNTDTTNWVYSGTLSLDTSPQLGGFLDANGNYMQTEKGGDIASASPLVIDTDGDYFDVSGTTNFAAMTVAADRQFTLQFDGVLTMTHHATNLDLPGEANITTAAGDVAVFQSTGANTVQCISYTKADGSQVADHPTHAITMAVITSSTGGSPWEVPAGVYSLQIEIIGGGGGGQAGGATWPGTGGGGGGYSKKIISVTPTDEYDITIGAGGASGASGATTTFAVSGGAAECTATGGGYGSGFVTLGGLGNGGDINLYGGGGTKLSHTANNGFCIGGGAAMYSAMVTNGPAASIAGRSYGGGASGGSTGGTGAAGVCILTYIVNN